MYKVIKTINNNAVLAVDQSNRETIVVGKGIGFSSSKGTILNNDALNKVFIHKKEAEVLNFIDSIPVDIIELTNRIIYKSQKHFNEKLNDSLLITLAEHISFAIERFNNKCTDNIRIYEVHYLYANEYEVGKRVVDYINKIKNIELPESEASLIALHFVNARMNNGNVGETLRLTKLAYQIISVINYHFHLTVDTTSLSFSRFVIHLKLLIVRCKESQNLTNIPNHSSILNKIEQEFLKNYLCAKKIVKLISDEYRLTVPDDEIFYLAVHIERLLHVN